MMMKEPTRLRAGERLCPACRSGFMPSRKDQKFCSSGCRKTAFSRKDREKNPHNSQYSPTKWRENLDLFDRNIRLVDVVGKEKDPEKRGAIIERIITLAENGHGQIRSLLTNKMFLYPDRTNKLLFCPGYEHMGTIAQIANRYSWRMWGCSITEVLKIKKVNAQ